MDYKKLAEEFLAVRAEQLKVPANQQLSKMVMGELFVLNYLSTHNNIAYPKDLSREMAVSSARIAVILNNTEKKGWITRTRDTKDNRQIIVKLTAKGFQAIMKKRAEVIDSIARILEQIGTDDACEFLRIQKKITKNCFIHS